MTRSKRRATTTAVKEAVAEQKDLLRPLVQELLQEVLEGEMTEALQARKGERTVGRLGYRAGYYERSLVTRVGKLELRVPQDRHGQFSTEVFDRYQRSEKALVLALVEMYIHGVSTRKVKAITEELCGQLHPQHAAAALLVDANRDQHCPVANVPRLTHPLISRIENQIRIRFLQLTVGKGLQLDVERAVNPTHRRRAKRMAVAARMVSKS